jgi:hypothetical protein
MIELGKNFQSFTIQGKDMLTQYDYRWNNEAGNYTPTNIFTVGDTVFFKEIACRIISINDFDSYTLQLVTNDPKVCIPIIC